MGYSSVSLAHSVFTPTMEKDLADHLTNLTHQNYGLSLEKTKELAYLKIPDSWISEEKAGRGWWIGFKRKQNLSLRTPEATSIGRCPDNCPNGTRSRMDTIPNGHDPEWTRSRMDTIPNGHDPEWTQSRTDTIPNEHLHNVVYVCF